MKKSIFFAAILFAGLNGYSNTDTLSANEVQCEVVKSISGEIRVEECTYLNKDMFQVYDIVKEKDDHLLQELPLKNKKHKNEAYDGVDVIYTYKNKQHLIINLNYTGFYTKIEIIEKEQYTLVIETETYNK